VKTDKHEWYYGPYIKTRLSPTALRDYLELPSEVSLETMADEDIQGEFLRPEGRCN
jgi:hypothetical protein